MRPRRWRDWICYSGAAVSVTVNPFHWSLLPWFRDISNWEWPGPNERTWSMGWLFLTLRVWIDDGAW